MGHSVLLVPVPQLEEFVRGRTIHYDTDYLSADPAFTHAHVTALGPFVDHLGHEVEAAIARIAAETEPFDFVLERVATFPNGIVHLLPDPDSEFRALTSRLWAEFPDFPPYAGAFSDPVPHLTLDALSGEISEEATRQAVSSYLPAPCRAERLDLAWYAPGDCRVLASWPLGRTARRAVGVAG